MITLEPYVPGLLSESELEALSRAYHESFPPEERRPWHELLAVRPDFSLLLLRAEGLLVGMLTVWELKHALFAEHFLVFPDYRAQGYGAEALKALRQSLDPARPLALECERACAGSLAERRLSFYRRLSFDILIADYVQPPYTPSHGSVPMHLLATHVLSAHEAGRLRQEIYQTVYGIAP